MATVAEDIPLGATLTEEQARLIFSQGEEAVVFVILELAKQLAEQKAAAAADSHQTPSTPSGMKPPYTKPPPKRRGKKKPGRKKGHPGARREPPSNVDWQKDHRADCCPDCGGPLNCCDETRTRYTEDIPDIQPEVTEHTIHRDWCPKCKKKVEPKVSEAMPGSSLGNRVLVLSAWLHYALGNTLSQIVEVFNFHLQMKVSEGGLVQMWYRLQAILFGWYEQIQQEALNSAVLFADETSWRVSGKTYWLWCFATGDVTYYMIDRSRGSPALMKFFIQEFGGTLVSDFWGPYNAVVCAFRQKCLAVHQLSVRLGYRLEVDQVHVLLAEDPLLRLADADDDQTFAVAQLKCVVHDPHPVVCPFLRTVEVVQAQPQQPQSHRVETGLPRVDASPLPTHRLDARYTPQPRSGGQPLSDFFGRPSHGTVGANRLREAAA
jgi:transposase